MRLYNEQCPLRAKSRRQCSGALSDLRLARGAGIDLRNLILPRVRPSRRDGHAPHIRWRDNGGRRRISNTPARLPNLWKKSYRQVALNFRFVEVAGMARNNQLAAVDDANPVGKFARKLVVLLDEQYSHSTLMAQE